MDKVGLVLVPGLLCDAQLWRAQVDELADIAEMWIPDHTRSDTMAGVARDVLGEVPFDDFALAGLSMGGYVSLEIMRQAPQRVRKLALLDTVARADTPLTDAIKLMAKNVGKEGFIRQQRAIMSRADSRPLLAAIGCPTLVLCGRQDQLTPLDRHEEMAAGIQGSRLEVLEDCGHMSTMEKPDQVNHAMRLWLS